MKQTTKPKRSGLFLAASLLFLTGCATNVHVDYERGVDFASYQTFAIDPRAERAERDSVVLSEIVDRRIENALRTELSTRGLTPATGEPDLRVNFFVVTRTRTELIDRSHRHGGFGAYRTPFGRYPRGYYHHLWYRDFEIQEYEEGTFVVDLIDTQRDELVWRGTYTRRVGWSAPTEADIAEMLSKLLASYPPMPGA